MGQLGTSISGPILAVCLVVLADLGTMQKSPLNKFSYLQPFKNQTVIYLVDYCAVKSEPQYW